MTTDAGAVDDIARLCRASVDLLDVTGVGVSLITPTGIRGRVGASNDLAVQIEELQFSLGEGPCIDAFTHDKLVMVADLSDDSTASEASQWPMFADAAKSAGVRAIFALPLRSGSHLVGAIDLIRDRPGLLDRDRLTLAHAIADVAATTLTALDSDGGQFLDDEASRSAYRLEVHQASGMISVQLGVSVEDALARLRAEAFAAGRPIGDVAADVVGRRLRFNREGGE